MSNHFEDLWEIKLQTDQLAQAPRPHHQTIELKQEAR